MRDEVAGIWVESVGFRSCGLFYYYYCIIFFYRDFIFLEPLLNIFLEMTNALPYGTPDFKPLGGACANFRVPGRNE